MKNGDVAEDDVDLEELDIKLVGEGVLYSSVVVDDDVSITVRICMEKK